MASLLRLFDDLERYAQISEYSPARLAELMGVPLRRLERQFQTQFRCSPREYLIETRMARARRLLLTGMSVKAVSLTLGYRNPSNFCNDFKSRNGVSALEFFMIQMGRCPLTSTENGPAGTGWAVRKCE